MDVELPISHVIGNEIVVRVSGSEAINRAVFTKNGDKVGRVTRVFGPVDKPMGVIILSRNIEPGSNSLYIKN
jgi:RNA-binding protein involved in rRNA processing